MPTYAGELPQSLRLYCNTCGRETNHRVCHSEQFFYPDYVDDHLAGYEEAVLRMLLCQGCDTGSLEQCWTMSGHVDQSGKQVYSASYSPPRMAGHVARRKFNKLPDRLDRIYAETISAFNSGTDVLCSVGLRSLIEGICADKAIVGCNLKVMINGLTDLLPANIVDRLHSFRFMGNTAAHELQPPDRRDLKLAIEVSEDLLNYLYDLDYKVSRLPMTDRAAVPGTHGA
jgi:hypothetical protein